MNNPPPTLTLLGTGQDGGVPQAGCGCDNCSAAFENAARARFPVSLGVQDLDGGMHLIEATRALPEQLRLWANACSLDNPVRPDSVLLTHAHLGHIEGIGQFGREAMGCQNIGLVVSDSVASVLQSRNLMQPFTRIDRNNSGASPMLEQGGIRFEFIPVPHRDDSSDTHAILIAGGKNRVLFLPDHDDWKQTLELVGHSKPREWFDSLGLTHILLDATFWNGDELPSRDMTEVPHPTVEETISRLEDYTDEGPEIILIHLNHTNPLNDPNSPQSRLIEVAGLSIGTRGWSIEL
ncbi:MAG: MBL fold metallo-hydrolase [Candidatus Poseidoniales archaeon]|nr:MBL fold metallo-hydrolase [Candidatus Poseidoniales archaeon]|tara:strand:+ start:9915 stop:10793 length:879 start_codon:yes stop_codon:yes gene_type:complete